ncbi:hypothetical protein [Candidatus Avelusimicrobium luingense]|uniref:hypothetical protein n=1 Tax=Candidatus Avelusimicrobium luingense TaxID=3416211 RepID=UPI003D121508
MKWFCGIILLFIGTLTAQSEPYAVLKNAEQNHSYGIDIFLSGRPIRYAIESDITPQERTLFLNNLRAWPKKTWQTIPQDRKNEFSDILPLLQRPVKLEETTSQQADVIFNIGKESDFAREDLGYDACGTHTSSYPHVISINPACRHKFDEISLHEIGHFYGLADQYPEAHNASQQYYGSVNKTEYSVMYSLPNDSFHQEFTCDDADGFINLVDLRLFQKNGKFPSRAIYGWKSLCTDKLEYQKSTKSKGSSFNGKIFSISHNVLPLFFTSNSRAIRRDKDTQIVTDINDGSAVPPCPAGSGRWRVFTYDKAYEQLNIYCVKGNSRPKPEEEPDFHFPLPTAAEWQIQIHDKNTIHLDFFKQKLRAVSLSLIHTNVAGHSHISMTVANRLLSKQPYTEVDIYDNGEHFSTTVPLHNNGEILRVHPTFGPVLFKLKQELDRQTRYAISFDKDFYQPLIQTPQRRAYAEELKRQMPAMLKPTPTIPFAP